MSIARRKLPLIAIAALSVGACGEDGDGGENGEGAQSGVTLQEVQNKIRAFCIQEVKCEAEEDGDWTSGSGAGSWSSSSSGSSSHAPLGTSKSKVQRAKLLSQAVYKGESATDSCEARIQREWGKKSDMSEECSEAVLDLLHCYARLPCVSFFDNDPCPSYSPKARLCGWNE